MKTLNFELKSPFIRKIWWLTSKFVFCWWHNDLDMSRQHWWEVVHQCDRKVCPVNRRRLSFQLALVETYFWVLLYWIYTLKSKKLKKNLENSWIFVKKYLSSFHKLSRYFQFGTSVLFNFEDSLLDWWILRRLLIGWIDLYTRKEMQSTVKPSFWANIFGIILEIIFWDCK